MFPNMNPPPTRKAVLTVANAHEDSSSPQNAHQQRTRCISVGNRFWRPLTLGSQKVTKTDPGWDANVSLWCLLVGMPLVMPFRALNCQIFYRSSSWYHRLHISKRKSRISCGQKCWVGYRNISTTRTEWGSVWGALWPQNHHGGS